MRMLSLKHRRFLITGVMEEMGNLVEEDCVLDLAEALRARDATVDIKTVPFHGFSEDALLLTMTSWALIETESLPYEYDAVICTSFPSMLLRHNRKIVWMTADYDRTHKLQGHEVSLFRMTLTSEHRRMMAHRMLANSLKLARGVFFASEALQNGIMQFTGVHGKFLGPVCDKKSDSSWDKFIETLLEPVNDTD